MDADYRGVVRLRNVPFVGGDAFYGMSAEVTGSEPLDVVMPRHPDGKFTGDAFLTYSSEEVAEEAAKKLKGYKFQSRDLDSQVVSSGNSATRRW